MKLTKQNITNENAELIYEAILGNNRAVEGFYKLIIPYIKSVVRKLNFQFQVNDIDSLCQDLFVKIYYKLPKYNPSMSIYSWVFTVIKNSLCDEKRKCENHRVIKFENSSENPHNDALNKVYECSFLSPEDLIINKEKKEELFELIDRLNPTEKKIITEYFFLEKSLKELSDDYQISVNSISIRIHRAVKKLKSLPNLPEYPLLHHE